VPPLSFTCRWVRDRAPAQPRTSPFVAGSHQVTGSSTLSLKRWLPGDTVTARQRVSDSDAPCRPSYVVLSRAASGCLLRYCRARAA
jgi:hypothetical protein